MPVEVMNCTTCGCYKTINLRSTSAICKLTHSSALQVLIFLCI